jgi:hypothetical protein
LRAVIVRVAHGTGREVTPAVAMIVSESRSGLVVRIWRRCTRNPAKRWDRRRIEVPWMAVARDATPREALLGFPVGPVPRPA